MKAKIFVLFCALTAVTAHADTRLAIVSAPQYFSCDLGDSFALTITGQQTQAARLIYPVAFLYQFDEQKSPALLDSDALIMVPDSSKNELVFMGRDFKVTLKDISATERKQKYPAQVIYVSAEDKTYTIDVECEANLHTLDTVLKVMTPPQREF